MPVPAQLMMKINQYERQGYSPDEIVQGISESENYPDMAAMVSDYQKQGYSTIEIVKGLKSSPVAVQPLSWVEAAKTPAPVKDLAEFMVTPPRKPTGVQDFIANVGPESGVRLGLGLVAAPIKAVADVVAPMVKALGKPIDENGVAQTTSDIWDAVGQTVQGFADFAGQGIGNVTDTQTGLARFSLDKLKEAWGTDPVGSVVSLMGIVAAAKVGREPKSAMKEFIDIMPEEQKSAVMDAFDQIRNLPPEVVERAFVEKGVAPEKAKEMVAQVQEPVETGTPATAPLETAKAPKLRNEKIYDATSFSIEPLRDSEIKNTPIQKRVAEYGVGEDRAVVVHYTLENGKATDINIASSDLGETNTIGPAAIKAIFRDIADRTEATSFSGRRISGANPERDITFDIKPSRTISEVDRILSTSPPDTGEAGAIIFNRSPQTKTFSFSDPITEGAFQSAQGVPKVTMWEKTGEFFQDLWAKASRNYENLPKNSEFSELNFHLVQLAKQRGIASAKTLQGLKGLTADLKDGNLYDLYRRKVILDDLLTTVEEGKAIPFGFTKDSLKTELARLDAEIAVEPKVGKALSDRSTLWDAIKKDYSDAMDSIGFDVKERLKNESYFRHMVLDYAQAKGGPSGQARLKTPTSRGFLKERRGSESPINTDYLQAEYEVMAQMMYDTEIGKTIHMVDKSYNITEALKKEAKKQTKAAQKIDTDAPAVDWHTLIPDGYKEWQPRQGNVFYMSDTVPAKMAEQLKNGILEELNLTADDLRQTLSVGGKRREFIVKDEVAATLDDMTTKSTENAISQWSKDLLKTWKVWTLVSPRRWFKYNLRNMTGDADAAFVGNPHGFLNAPKAIGELYGFYFKGGKMTPELRGYFERGGMETTLQFQEIGDINSLKFFKDLGEQHGGVTHIPGELWNKYWTAARVTTDFREQILRYANYLDYIKQMEKSGGTPKNFGASIKEEVMGLSDIRDRAFRLSDDLLGAYDRVSVLGGYLREHLYPFWSWKELNFKRYIQLAKNVTEDGNLATAIGLKAVGTLAKTPYMAYRIGSFLAKATALWSGLQVWNHTMFPELESQMAIEEASRPHIILGQTADGKIINFNRMGALGDFLQWFGLDGAPKHVDAWFKGRMTLQEIAVDMAKSPVNVVTQGLTPYATVPAQLLARQSFFPNIFKPGTIRDRSQFLAQSLGLADEYKAVAGVPSEGYASSIPKFFLYESDPLQASYGDIQDEKRRFLEKIGKGYEGFILTPKGNALYNVKLAIRYADEQAMDKYMEQYAELGGTAKGLKESLKLMQPMSGLSKKEQGAFIASLDNEGLEKLDRAMRFYGEVLLGERAQKKQEARP